LQPAVLRWARERAGLDVAKLAAKFPVRPERVTDWETSGSITMAQADKLARCTYTPVGYLYLSEPPDDRLPIADFRTPSAEARRRPSPNLLETVHLMQRRQAWMRDDIIEEGGDVLRFVASHDLDSSPEHVASAMHDALGLTRGWAAADGAWSGALRRLRNHVESAGVLVVFNGIVGNNTRRKLDCDEFQGFALVDEYSPLIFVNSSDFVAAQMFTLCHELAHIFIGEDGISKFEALQPSDHVIEKLCNQTAAEFLVPSDDLRRLWSEVSHRDDTYDAIARHFKVSQLVAARRAQDVELISRNEFLDFYERFRAGERQRDRSSGGNFWNTQNTRIGRRFEEAIVRAVREDRLLYREAYALTGLKGETFERLVARNSTQL
jgi:Zn-dependent peptidase ImmA (M78 family)